MTRLFVKNLTVIDFSYLDPKRGLLGESWIVDIELTGSLDHQGMVLDFSDVKKKVKQLIDADFDHKLIVPKQYSENQQSVNGKRIQNTFTTNNGIIIEHIAPESAYYFLDADTVTPEKLATAIIQKLNPILPDNVENVALKLYPEKIDGAFYHYSHGLKHHAGNCQRIAHGHRSKIEVFEKDNRNHEIEQFWADKWEDVYIGTKTDIFKQFTKDSVDYIHFQYTACQGLFELIIPSAVCHLVDVDSTVENLAQHVTNELKLQYPKKHLTIHAYEGVGKGAICST